MKKIIFYIFLVNLSLFLDSCASLGSNFFSGRTYISQIKSNPEYFENKRLTLEGEVVSALPVLGGLFQIYEAQSDDTIWIKLGQGMELPKVRTFVRLRGIVDPAFKILNQNYGTVLKSDSLEILSSSR